MCVDLAISLNEYVQILHVMSYEVLILLATFNSYNLSVWPYGLIKGGEIIYCLARGTVKVVVRPYQFDFVLLGQKWLVK